MWAWLASTIFPMIAITYALSRMSEVREHQRAIALAKAPDSTAASLDRSVNVTVWIAVAALAVVVAVVMILAILMVKRRAWARIGLLVAGVVEATVSLIAVDALSDDAAAVNRTYVLIGIGLQVLLALIGAILMYRPAANTWFNTRPVAKKVTSPVPSDRGQIGR